MIKQSILIRVFIDCYLNCRDGFFFQQSLIRCNSHRPSFRIQSFVCSASIHVLISGVSGIDYLSNIDRLFLSSMPHRLTKSTLFATFQLISFPNESQFSFISSVVISRAVLCSPSILSRIDDSRFFTIMTSKHL